LRAGRARDHVASVSADVRARAGDVRDRTAETAARMSTRVQAAKDTAAAARGRVVAARDKVASARDRLLGAREKAAVDASAPPTPKAKPDEARKERVGLGSILDKDADTGHAKANEAAGDDASKGQRGLASVLDNRDTSERKPKDLASTTDKARRQSVHTRL
jgi:hypothetical protein